MDNRWILCLLLLAVGPACSEEAVHVPEARTATAFLYVDVPELELRQSPTETAPVVATYKLGEQVSVLAEKDGWAEIRVGYDGSGWGRRDALAEEKSTFDSAGEAQARFVRAPNSVLAPPGVTGHLYLQASVNTEGAVVDVEVIQNTTGSESLAAQNTAALRRATFYPMIINGRTRPFIYDHVVNY